MNALFGAALQLLALVIALFVSGIVWGVLGVLGVVAVGLYLLGDAVGSATPPEDGDERGQ